VVVEGRIASHDDPYQLTAVTLSGGQQLSVPRLEAEPGTPVRLRIRARDVALALRPPHETSIQNVLRGRVVELGWQDGPFVEINVAIGPDASLTARLTRRAADTLQLTAGREVYALIKTIALDRVVPGGAG
jgi:molybdate transport system ATP-binding protein